MENKRAYELLYGRTFNDFSEILNFEYLSLSVDDQKIYKNVTKSLEHVALLSDAEKIKLVHRVKIRRYTNHDILKGDK